ncbi:MAG TPA: ATP-binding protein [Thermodesulfovibrionales bacterium]|nr:ATP-binding protein [Thermodesulfovibrionales bacterium]
MKIEHKLMLSYVVNIIFIMLIGIFSLDNMNVTLTKLKFVEIADDLNASFLEMRLAEKNFFLFKDTTSLDEIDKNIKSTLASIETVRDDIERAIGAENLTQLKTFIDRYSKAIEDAKGRKTRSAQSDLRLRLEGRNLRDFFKTITQLERKNVNDIILRSKKILLISFLVILLLSAVGGRLISRNIVNSMRTIEGLAISISKGDFTKIEDVTSRDECGSVLRAINVMSEELKNREEEIIQSKKLASLGILTAGVAHELRNPLNNISMVAQNFIEMHDSLSREQMIELMTRVEEETKRIEDTVKHLLDFAKPREVHLKEADINDTIQQSVKLIQNVLDISDIELSLSLDPSIPHVFIDEPQIQEVLVNLMENAVQAMTPGGTIFIASNASESKDTVAIEVKDTGSGIPPEVLPNIFDPFFTTKGVDGTGLGMSISYGIVKNHRGTIRVESAVDVGTTFTIELPAHK